MKPHFSILTFSLLLINVCIINVCIADPTSIMGRVRFTVLENSPVILKRSQNIVHHEFHSTFENAPELQMKEFEITTAGPDVIISFVTLNENGALMQKAVSSAVGKMSGKVDGGGEFITYKLSQPLGELDVKFDPKDRTKIGSLTARSVPFREFLRVVHQKIPSFSYVVSKECGKVRFDWPGNTIEKNKLSEKSNSKKLDEVFENLPASMQIRWEKTAGPKPIYVFGGPCQDGGDQIDPDTIVDAAPFTFPAIEEGFNNRVRFVTFPAQF